MIFQALKMVIIVNNHVFPDKNRNCSSVNHGEISNRTNKDHGDVHSYTNDVCSCKGSSMASEKQGGELHVLEARNLSFSYNSKSLFEDFSLRVASNERIALSAHSGVGKTTLCRLLAGYLEPKTGGVYIDGALLPKAGVCPVQMIFQHPEQVMNPYVRIRKSLGEAGCINENHLKALGIRPDWLTRFPHELSGGELQRCCIARALAAKPQFIIADEISTMLDALTQAQIWEFLLSYCQIEQVGLVVVTHSRALQQRLVTRVVNL